VVLAGVLSFAARAAEEQAPAPAAPPPAAPKKPVAAPPVDLNGASRAELKKLPGIGDAEAKKIIAGRPWLTKADLVTKGVIPEGTYAAIKGRIVAKQHPPAAKKP
jgi:DNA uptake protein ComE-like DNA-binding protein